MINVAGNRAAGNPQHIGRSQPPAPSECRVWLRHRLPISSERTFTVDRSAQKPDPLLDVLFVQPRLKVRLLRKH